MNYKTTSLENNQIDYLTACFGSVYSNILSEKKIRDMAKKWFEIRDVIKKDHNALIQGKRAKLYNKEVLNSINNGGIIASIHSAAYAYPLSELCHMGFNMQLLISNEIAKTHGAFFKKISNSFGSKLDILVAENIMSIKKVFKHLKKGGLTYIYMDGNTGVGGVQGGDRNKAEVKILGKTAKVRTGVFYLAQRAMVPVVSALSYYNSSGMNCVEFFGPISPLNKTEKERIQCTNKIYDYFNHFVEKYPEQWEVWFYPYRIWTGSPSPIVTIKMLKRKQKQIFKFIDKNQSKIYVKADPLKIGILKSSEVYIIFDSKTQRVLCVNPVSYKILKESFNMISLKELSKNYEKKIFIHEASKLVLSGLIQINTNINN